MSNWETTYALLVVQVTLLSVMAGIAYLVIARRHPATAKRVLALTVLLLLGLTGIAVLPLPGFWSLDIWPEETVIARPVESAPGGRSTIDQEASTGMPDVSWTSVADTAPVPARLPDSEGSAPSPSTTVVFRWTLLLELLLLAGGAVVATRLTWGLWSTHRLLGRSRKVDDVAIVGLAEEIRRSIGCRRVELRVSTEISSAATVGWRRPVLIVAADWRQWSERELRAVFAHEMTHVRSNDYLMGLFARITVALYFYHPLVRWLGTRFFLAQEAVADAAAARFVGGRADYLAALSRIALRQDRQLKSLPVLAFGSSFTTFLMRRIEMLEIREDRRRPLMRLYQRTIVACLCLGAVALSALRAPADDVKAESEVPARGARQEAASSADGHAGSAAEGTSPKSEALPPLPTSATYTTFYRFDGEISSTTETMVLVPRRSRTEASDGDVTISNRGTVLSVDRRDKEARITEYPEEEERPGLFGRLRKLVTDPQYLPETKREVLGDSEIDGRRTVGYRFTEPGRITTLWADPDNLLPIQIEEVSRMHPNMRVILTDFVYNVDLDESLFDVEPPAGYAVFRRTVPKESTPSGENDLVELFRQYRENGKDTFPDTVDFRAALDLERMKFDLRKERTEEQRNEIMDFAKKVIRGPLFVAELPPEADAHYAGKGVKLDATDTPIFWHRPEGKGKYRVIRADLSVIETDTPPEIPGAQVLSDWGKEELASRRPWQIPANPAAAFNVENLAPLVRQLGILPFSLRNELKVRVLPGSAAEKAGIRSGDRITGLSGVSVERVEHVAALWALLPFYAKARQSLVDDGVPLTILRDEEQMEVRLPGDALQPFLNPTDRAGNDVQSLLSLVRQIGIEPDSDAPTLSGVLKVRILPGSAAEKAGIRSGDRITALNGDEVVRLKDLVALLAWVPLDNDTRQSIAKEKVRLTLQREGEQIEVTLPGDVIQGLVLPSGPDGR